MFARSYFSGAYFPPVYFPPVVALVVVIPTPAPVSYGDYRQYAGNGPGGAFVPIRRQAWIDASDDEIVELIAIFLILMGS
jgi:hypothetical protein